MALILFLCVGAVSANENKTLDDNNIKDLIDNCEDNGIVELGEKTYHLNQANETHIVLNKSVTVEGIKDKSVIDGNNTSLFFDVNETEDIENDGIRVVLWPEGYEIKNLGKNITFENVTFKNVKITTWHEMKFSNCKFINAAFTSYEYGNTFMNCSFDKSEIEIALFLGYGNKLYADYSKIMNCSFYDSRIKSKSVRTSGYIEIVGGDRFYTVNTLDLMNSEFYNTNISLSRYNMIIDSSRFKGSNIMGHSTIANITNTILESPKINFGMSDISIKQTNITDSQAHFSAGYFAKGCYIDIESSIINNMTMEFSVNYASRQSYLKIKDSYVNDSDICPKEATVEINNTIFNKSELELSFSKVIIQNSTFFNDGKITDTIKTVDYDDEYVFNDDSENTGMKRNHIPYQTDYTVENSYFINGSGKYEILYKDINIDTLYELTYVEKEVYYFNDKIIFNLKDHEGNNLRDVEIFIRDLNSDNYDVLTIKTDENGNVRYTIAKIGNLSIYVYYQTRGLNYMTHVHGITLNLTVLPTITGLKIEKKNFASNTYSNIKGSLKITPITNGTGNLANLKFSYKVYTNGKYKTYTTKTNSKGATTFNIPKTLTAGSHKIVVNLLNTNVKKTITVKIAKAKTTVKAPKVTKRFKKSEYFKVTVKNKATKKVVSNVKVKIKVYTGKKYKTYTVKTNKNGIAKINTKNLKVGKHRVVISSANGNYMIKAGSEITII